MKLCKDCRHYRGQCLRHSYRQTAPSTGVTKLYGAIDALIERKSYHAYRCGHDARYWEPIAIEGEA